MTDKLIPKGSEPVYRVFIKTDNGIENQAYNTFEIIQYAIPNFLPSRTNVSAIE